MRCTNYVTARDQATRLLDLFDDINDPSRLRHTYRDGMSHYPLSIRKNPRAIDLWSRMDAAQTKQEERYCRREFVKLLPTKGSRRLYLGSYARPGTDDDNGNN